MKQTICYIIADDEKLTRASILKSIQEIDEECFFLGEAFNGVEALSILENKCVDLIISDIRMPVMDGLELCDHLRAKYPWVRILLISGYSEFEYAQRALRYGVKDYLLKPIEPLKLKNSIHHIIADILMEELKEADYIVSILLKQSLDFIDVWKTELVKSNIPVATALLKEECDRLFSAYRCRPRFMLQLLDTWCSAVLKITNLAIQIPLLDESYSFHPDQVVSVEQSDRLLNAWAHAISMEIGVKSQSTGRVVVEKIKNYIYINYHQEITLDELSHFVNFNKTYLAGAFKKLTNMTIGHYIQEVRMENAGRLLRSTDGKIYEIARMVGYQDLAHFTKMFKSYFGVSPHIYKNMTNQP